MIFEPQKYSFIMQDAVYSLAIGFVCGFINRILSCFLYKGKVRLFIKDVLMTFVFTTLVFSYAVSFANYKVMRWYNVFFALMGMVFFRPCFDRAVRILSSLAAATAKYIFALSRDTAVKSIKEYYRKKAVKHQKNTQNLPPEPLQDNDKVLYN